jgi:hypothetical protein
MATVMNQMSVVNQTNASSVLTQFVTVVETAVLDSIAVVESQKVFVVKVVWGSPALLMNSVPVRIVVEMVSVQVLAVCAIIHINITLTEHTVACGLQV